MKLPEELRKYFWDVDFEKINPEEKSQFVATRVLEYGDAEAAKWLFDHIDKKVIEEVLEKRRGLSPKSRRFWGMFFGIPRETLNLWMTKLSAKTAGNPWQK